MLENWYWHTLDWLCDQKGENLDDIISLIHHGAMEYDPDPEGEFKAGLAYYIHRGAMFHISQDDGLANDDWCYPAFGLKCQFMLARHFNRTASSDMAGPELRAPLKPDFNKAAYKFPRRKIAVKSQRTFFTPLEV